MWSAAQSEDQQAELSTQARVKAACEFTAQPKLGNGGGALERWPRKQALTIGRGAGTEQRGEVGLSHVIERIADRNVCGVIRPATRKSRPSSRWASDNRPARGAGIGEDAGVVFAIELGKRLAIAAADDGDRRVLIGAQAGEAKLREVITAGRLPRC